MNTNPFNICPSCTEVNICVLTKAKEKVWSCSEYNELSAEKAREDDVTAMKQEMQAV